MCFGMSTPAVDNIVAVTSRSSTKSLQTWPGTDPDILASKGIFHALS